MLIYFIDDVDLSHDVDLDLIYDVDLSRHDVGLSPP